MGMGPFCMTMFTLPILERGILYSLLFILYSVLYIVNCCNLCNIDQFIFFLKKVKGNSGL